MKKKLTVRHVQQAFAVVLRRFPVPFVFLTLLVLFMCVDVVASLPAVVCHAAVSALAEGALMSLVVNIWSGFTRRDYVRAGMIIVILISAADFTAIMVRGNLGDNAEMLGRVALYTALAVAIVYLPAVRRFTQSQLWSYTVSQVKSICVGALLSFTMLLFVLAVTETCRILFGVYSRRFFTIMWYIGCLWLPGIYYLTKVPRRRDILRDGLPGGSLSAFCLKVLLPLLAVYGGILYVYLFRVFLKWSLPVSSLSTMTTVMTAGVLTVLYGLMYYIFTDTVKPSSRRIAAAFRRMVPWALLPLLVASSVGLVYRIGEYGITASRLYVGAFILWSYAVAVYLIVSRNANLNRVAASFAVVFVMVSVIPGFNFTSIAEASVRSRILRTLDAAGVKDLPIDEAQLKEVVRSLDRKDAENLVSQIQYLDNWNDHSGIADIVTTEDGISYYGLLNDAHDTVTRLVLASDSRFPVPSGYDSFSHIVNTDMVDVRTDASHVSLPLNDSVTCEIMAEDVLKIVTDEPFDAFITTASGGRKFVVTEKYVRFSASDSLSVSVRVTGYLFSGNPQVSHNSIKR